MEVCRVIVWGTRTEYDLYRKWFEVEILKGNMQIEAIILNEEYLFQRMDGIDVISIEAIRYIDFDYLIDMNENTQDSVLRILELLKIPLDKVIPVRVFGQPFFDLARWVQVKNSEISILSGHCWGGYAYNTLGLQFRTPLINMRFENKDFFRLLEDVEGYMQLTPEKIGEKYEINLQRNFPVVQLGDVTIEFNHYTDFDEALQIWNRRKERINYQNILVEMTADSMEDIDRFLKLPYEHKICFTMLPCEEKDVISIQNPYMLNLYGDRAWRYALGTANKSFGECKPYDLLKLLNHEEDYWRAEFV